MFDKGSERAEPKSGPVETARASADGRHGRRASGDLASLPLPGGLARGSVPLPQAARAYFEPRFGTDLSAVRIRHDDQAAAMAADLRASAFTVGRLIGFGAGRFDPTGRAGRHLLAHEIAHVAQQRNSTPGAPRILRQDDPDDPLHLPEIAGDIERDPGDRRLWRRRVDQRVRSVFGLRGAGLSTARVRFAGETDFYAGLSATTQSELLLEIFIDHGRDIGSLPYQVLHHQRHPYRHVGLTGNRWAVDRTLAGLRRVVEAGVAAGYFMAQSREWDVASDALPPPRRVTPTELIRRYSPVAGITEIEGPRSRRRVVMNDPATVTTLVHEACHFYVSSAFRDRARGRSDGDSLVGGARIVQILMEGFAEYFARQVMNDMASDYAVVHSMSYQREVAQVHRLVATVGEAGARAAYFRGDGTELDRLHRAVDEYKRTHPELLVPGFMVSSPPARGPGVD